MVVVVIALSLLLAINGLYTFACISRIRELQLNLTKLAAMQNLQVDAVKQLITNQRALANAIDANQRALATAIDDLEQRRSAKVVTDMTLDPTFKTTIGEA